MSHVLGQNPLLWSCRKSFVQQTIWFNKLWRSYLAIENPSSPLENLIFEIVQNPFFQVKRLTDSFRTRDKEMKGQALLGYEDFVGLAIGAHR